MQLGDDFGRHSNLVTTARHTSGIRTLIERIYDDVHWNLSRIPENVL